MVGRPWIVPYVLVMRHTHSEPPRRGIQASDEGLLGTSECDREGHGCIVGGDDRQTVQQIVNGNPAPGKQAHRAGQSQAASVNPVTEFAGSRVAMGAYQSNLKVIAALDDLNRRTVDLLKIRGESFA